MGAPFLLCSGMVHSACAVDTASFRVDTSLQDTKRYFAALYAADEQDGYISEVRSSPLLRHRPKALNGGQDSYSLRDAGPPPL
jgi:hypothetical protein